MATYVPGVETYLPDIKPFTPDYKFLSAVLDVRTDKYNTNWKATNDLYNKVVYADLSRTDTKEQRDQYINQIAPSLEKIAGMDLSMIQNADSAQAVFAPFFEDDLIVSDIMHTSNYRKEMDYANRLETSPDQEQRMRYNEDGVRGLQYHMEDFITSAPDKAMKMGLPQFVEGANMMVMAQKILGEMKPPLKMKKDSTQGDWIITQQNGSLIIPAAKAYIEQALLNDPRIQSFYKNQAFVRSRDRAAEGIARGEFATVEQGQGVWAEETINRITEQNQYYLEKERLAAAEQKNVNDKYKNLENTTGIVPGSDDEKAKNEQLNMYERTKAALEARENVKQLSNEPAKDFQSTLAKAYRLYQAGNIGRDIDAAAAEFASRDSEYTIKENPFVKQKKDFEYDMAKLEYTYDRQKTNAEDLAMLKGKIDYDLAKAKGAVLADNPILKANAGAKASEGNATNSEYPLDKEGKLDANTDMNKMNEIDYTQDRNKTRDVELEYATKVLSFLNPAGQLDASGKPTQKYTVKVGGQNFTGTIDQIKNKLGAKDADGAYVYKTDIDALYYTQSNKLNDPKEMAKYPMQARSKTYADLYQQAFSDQGINTKITVQDQAHNEVRKIHQKAQKLSISELRKTDSKAKELLDAGLPEIYKVTASGIPVQMTKAEYIKSVKDLAQQGKIKDIDRTQMRKKEYVNYVDTEVMVNGKPRTNVEIVYSDQPLKNARKYFATESVMYTDKTGKLIRAVNRDELDRASVRLATVLSDRDIEQKAGLLYDKVKTYTNSALTMHKGDKFETATYKGYINGRTGGSDMMTTPVFKANVDPLSSSSEGQTILAQMMTQKNMLDSKGGGYTMVLGNLKDKTSKEAIVDNALARKAYNAYTADMITWVGNPKSSNTAAIAPRGTVTYSSTFGAQTDGAKTTAGYTIENFAEWASSKVKGTSKDDGTKEYGLFSKPEVDQLRNGISMVFEKKQDINPRSTNNTYYSKVLSAVQASPEKYAEYSYPGVDGMTPTATYRIVKTGTDQYYATYKYYTYQPDGTYSAGDWQQVPIEMGSYNPGQTIDARVNELKEAFEIKRQMNLGDYQKNSATKGKQN